MFYRSRFDGKIGAIFQYCGVSDSVASGYWTDGASTDYAKAGKATGTHPTACAISSFATNTMENQMSGRISAQQAMDWLAALQRWVDASQPKYSGVAMYLALEAKKHLGESVEQAESDIASAA